MLSNIFFFLFQAFLVYIYVVATAFLLYLQCYLLPVSKRDIQARERRKQQKRFLIFTLSLVNDSVNCFQNNMLNDMYCSLTIALVRL